MVFLYKTQLLDMSYRQNIAVINILIIKLMLISQAYSQTVPMPEIALTSPLVAYHASGDCNDTSGYKTMVDLEELSWLKDHFYCTAVKAVPGLGEKNWRGNSEVLMRNSDSKDFFLFTFSSYMDFDDVLELRESFASLIPKREGKYELHSISQAEQDTSLLSGGYYRMEADGDVFDGSWDIDTTCTNFIEIIQLSLEDQEICGRFELHFIKMTDGNNGNIYSDRIHFLQGDFFAYIRRF